MKIISTQISRIALLLALMAVAIGCRKRVIVTPHDPVEVRFSVISATTVPQTASRAVTGVNNDFTKASQIGVYATTSEEFDVRMATEANSNVGYGNPTGSTQWSVIEAGTAIRFFKDDQAMNFFGYHPFTAQTGSSVVMDADQISPTLTYTLPVNQSTIESLTNADLMWGTKFDVSESGGAVGLEFAHKLSKIDFSILAGEGWNGDEDLTVSRIEISGSNLSKKAKMPISTGVLTAETPTSTMVYCDYSPAMGLHTLNAQHCQFILIPTQYTELVLNITVVDANLTVRNYSATLAGVELKSGYMRQISLSIHKYNSMNIVLSPTIKPWDVISDIGMEAI